MKLLTIVILGLSLLSCEPVMKWACTHSPRHLAVDLADMKHQTALYGCTEWTVFRDGI